jgi:hypothetical protein
MKDDTAESLEWMSRLILAIADDDKKAATAVLTEVDDAPNGPTRLVYGLANSIVVMIQGLAGDKWREALEEAMRQLAEDD